MLHWTNDPDCCNLQEKRVKYLVMARRDGSQLVPTFIMPWKKSKVGVGDRFDGLLPTRAGTRAFSVCVWGGGETKG